MCLLDPKNNGVRQTTTTATSTTINDMHVSCNKSFSQSDRDSLYDCYDLELNTPTRRRANTHSKSNDELNEMGGRVRLAYYACAGMWPSSDHQLPDCQRAVLVGLIESVLQHVSTHEQTCAPVIIVQAKYAQLYCCSGRCFFCFV